MSNPSFILHVIQTTLIAFHLYIDQNSLIEWRELVPQKRVLSKQISFSPSFDSLLFSFLNNLTGPMTQLSNYLSYLR